MMTAGSFWWGGYTAKGHAVCLKCDLTGTTKDYISFIVGSHKPNPFAIYDMNGNVWEWTEGCWTKDYTNHPTNGSAWSPDDNFTKRVFRGGSWANGSRHLRSANRSWKKPNYRGVNGRGFRVALTRSK